MRHQAFHLPSYSSVRPDPWERTTAPGLDLALLAYAMFALGFLLPVLAPVGVILAYAGRARTRGQMGALARSHFERQIGLFWRSVLALLLVGVLHAVVVGFGAITFGFGLVLMVVPWGLGLGWLVWAVWQVGSGLLSAWRREPASR